MVVDHRYISPNMSSRKNTTVDTVIIHHTGGRFPGCVNWMCNSNAKASAHYVITKDGSIYQLVHEHNCAWHAGRSAFDYDKDGKVAATEKYLNRRSIGIELESMGDSYTQGQLNALNELLKDIIERHNIPVNHILGHKEVAPGRKWDPGNFDMNHLRLEIAIDLRIKDLKPIAIKTILGPVDPV